MAAVAPGAYAGRAVRSATREYEEEPFLGQAVDWLRLDARGMYDLIRDPVLAVRSEVPFSSLPTSGGGTEDAAGKADLLVGRLSEEGFDVLFVDFSPPGEEVHVVKAIVPGLEVETASYGRVGARNLKRLLERGDGIVGTGELPKERPRAKPILLPDAAREALGGARPGWITRPWSGPSVGCTRSTGSPPVTSRRSWPMASFSRFGQCVSQNVVSLTDYLFTCVKLFDV